MSTKRVVALACVLLIGCAGSLEHPERFIDGGMHAAADADASSLCGDAEALLRARCGTSCHDAAERTASLDLASVGIGTRLANKPATGGVGVLLSPGNPEASLIFQKLLPSPPYGARMPLGNALPSSDIECLRAWIAAK